MARVDYAAVVPIHPTAVVDPRARLGDGVDVGPYAVVGPDVVVGAGCRVGPHACLRGPMEIGEGCEICFSAALGHDPQVKGKPGPFGKTRIGARNVFREFSQVHRSFHPDGETVIGDDNYFMATAHVAHDCTVGNHVVFCNGVLLAGHVTVGDRVFMSGNAGVHQFSRVGELAMVGGLTSVPCDVPPYGLVVGIRPAVLEGLNLVGLKRAGVSPEARLALQQAYRTLFRTDLPLPERIRSVEVTTPEVEKLVAFVRSSKRGVVGFGASG